MKITIYSTQIEEALALYLEKKYGLNTEIDFIKFVENYHYRDYIDHDIDEIHVYIKERG